jgi:hypothetical protein
MHFIAHGTKPAFAMLHLDTYYLVGALRVCCFLALAENGALLSVLFLWYAGTNPFPLLIFGASTPFGVNDHSMKDFALDPATIYARESPCTHSLQ